MATRALACWDGNWFALTYCLRLYINLQGHQRMEINSFRIGEAFCVMVGVGGSAVFQALHSVSHRSHILDSPRGGASEHNVGAALSCIHPTYVLYHSSASWFRPI